MDDGSPCRPVGRCRARVSGAVQGVGFRPHVHALARRFGLSGWVRNDAGGVTLEVEGAGLDGFLEALVAEAPPLARIDAIRTEAVAPNGEPGFSILHSEGGVVSTRIGPDACVCEDCLRELFDPADRRYRYAFLNCTHCGPRYTITRHLPYDRASTSMAGFALCPACRAEYEDPCDRRFHAQPTACPACGPQLVMSVEETLARLMAGEIVAIKGLGGFHLACDARNPAAVQRLRERKTREAKPFAVMVAGVESARTIAHVSAPEAALLASRARPVVLLRAKAQTGLSDALAPGLAELGVMLPATPLQYLLFHEAAGRPQGLAWLNAAQTLVLVMTSANPGGEPLVTADEEARERLSGLADAIAGHDRAIVIRADDSVMRVAAGGPVFIRRARGYAPEPVGLPFEVPPVLALGGHLKATVCVTRGREAFVSQHVGDLDNAATYAFLRETVAHLTRILDVTPRAVACDLHPDFLSTRFADESGLPVMRVQHHHAHVAALAAEHGVEGPLPALVLDGYGYGVAGESWGGELMLADGGSCQRLGHLAPLAQPGGDSAAREPWRMASALLYRLGRGDEVARRFAHHAQAGALSGMLAGLLARGLNMPQTTSAGRLFDAVAGLLGVCEVSHYEAEAAMRLEALADTPCVMAGGWRIADGVLSLDPLLERLAAGMDAREGAGLFHGTLAAALCDWAAQAARAQGLDRVALSGGCFLNRVLLDSVAAGLAARGIVPLIARAVPPGDGGLSLGQAFVAARRLMEGRP